MHIHILGIGGTFMGGLAQIASTMGFRVTGQDRPLYPPMSTQLAAVNIVVREMSDVSFIQEKPGMVIVGNVMVRGMPAVEALLDSSLPFMSGPQWLRTVVLKDRWVLAVSGTHGKTTTSSMLAWILEYAQLSPGFLIGGVPLNFGCSARFSVDSPFFVVESDEYDSAFFDKRAKLVHFQPRTWVLNNLEYDHADIYDDLSQIQRQVHHGVRLVPASGLLVVPAGDKVISDVLAMGCWSQVESHGQDRSSGWSWQMLAEDASSFAICWDGQEVGRVRWALMGVFNVHNAMSAVLAARHAGVPVTVACEALSSFEGVARRLVCLTNAQANVLVYEDFAHHPTAIAVTLEGLRQRYPARRLMVVLEPRSNSMRSGVFGHALPSALHLADVVVVYREASWCWSIDTQALGSRLFVVDSYDGVVEQVLNLIQTGDVVVCMSNGGFGGVPQRIVML